jgi:Tol biopolymer transport system component
MTLPAGSRVGPYEVRGLIGAGGMGEVYRVRDTKLSREVALKVLPSDLAEDGRRVERFRKEALTASGLNHPNIVTVYDIGVENGRSYIAMELVEGRTLRQVLTPGPVPLRKLLSIAAQTADGLARAHAAGIVHRDLKPENLMITRDGFVKILDFGLAKLVRPGFEAADGGNRSTLTRVTEAGTVLGTVGYMSPEQASGEPADFRSDQFSLGSILYEMATGKRAFERGSDVQTLSAIIETEPEPLETAAPRLPTNVGWVVERCLAKDPEDRYGSTKDLARDLALLRDRSSGASGAGIAPPAGRRLRLTRLGLAAAVLGALGLAALAFFAGRRIQARWDREAPAPERTTLTFRRGYVTGARFAPDGQTIVYSAAWDGKPSDVFMTRVGSTESRSLGIPDAVLLGVSSTGEMALLLGCGIPGWVCLGTLARAPLAGGAPRELVDGANSADWSPDGKDLAVIRAGQVEYPVGKPLYNADRIGFLSHVRVSPDGSRVAFLDHPRRDSDRALVTVVDRAGKRKVLTTEWARLGPILWSPTGEELFFSTWARGETRGVSLSGRTRSASGVLGLEDVSRQRLFLDSGTRSFRGIVRALVPGSPQERNFSWLARSVACALSDDGQLLLLHEESQSRERPGEQTFTTFLRDTSGTDAKMLGEGRALALSPDKAWALVARAQPETHLVLLPTGAGEPKVLPGGGLLYRRAVFFPDGRRILFNADEVLGDIRSYVQDLSGGSPKPFGPEGFLAMAISPDGKSVAGFAEHGIGVVPADGAVSMRVIALSPDLGLAPLQWSADGKWIYLQGEEADEKSGTEFLTFSRLDLATGRYERWKRVAPPDMAGFIGYGTRPVGSGYALTPDGRYYAYTYYTDENRLSLVQGRDDWWR